MKYFSLIIFTLTLYTCTWKRNNEENKYSDNLKIFKADSGYINKKEALAFLLKNNLTDTIKSNWNLYNDAEIFGKYYKYKNTNEYLFCIMDLSKKYTFETHLLIKINSKGEITDTSRFIHWNYPACIDGKDALNKYGDYYGISICQTGSGFSAEYIYFFKDFVKQDKQNPILISLFSGIGYQTEIVNSSLKIKNDIIKLDYEVETTEETYETKVNLKQFKVDYFLKNNKWETKDSAKFEAIESFF